MKRPITAGVQSFSPGCRPDRRRHAPLQRREAQRERAAQSGIVHRVGGRGKAQDSPRVGSDDRTVVNRAKTGPQRHGSETRARRVLEWSRCPGELIIDPPIEQDLALHTRPGRRGAPHKSVRTVGYFQQAAPVSCAVTPRVSGWIGALDASALTRRPVRAMRARSMTGRQSASRSVDD